MDPWIHDPCIYSRGSGAPARVREHERVPRRPREPDGLLFIYSLGFIYRLGFRGAFTPSPRPPGPRPAARAGSTPPTHHTDTPHLDRASLPLCHRGHRRHHAVTSCRQNTITLPPSRPSRRHRRRSPPSPPSPHRPTAAISPSPSSHHCHHMPSPPPLKGARLAGAREDLREKETVDTL